MKMNYLSAALTVVASTIYVASSQECNVKCPLERQEMVCGFDAQNVQYKMFPNICAMEAHKECFKVAYNVTPLEFCVKHHNKDADRRVYGESCPVFCPTHYRPVCAAARYRDYSYRAFNNGCYLDMANCRGDDDFDGYIEVPLEYCQRHLMKNIFKEQVIMSNLHDYRDYQ